MGGSFVSYFCVSTDKQSRSGLGIEAQRAPLASYLAGFGAAPLAEFVEVESGKRNGRPELGRALSECRVRKATLVIAEFDRRARDAHFLLGLQRSWHRLHGRGYAERQPADSQHHSDGRITSGSRFGADSQRIIFGDWP